MDSQSQSQAFFDFDDTTQGESQQIHFVQDGDELDAGYAPTQDDDDVRAVTDAVEAVGLDEPAYSQADAAIVGDGSASAPLNFVEDYPGGYVDDESLAPAELPYWRCEYCNVHTPAAVVKCVATGKWFCNHK